MGFLSKTQIGKTIQVLRDHNNSRCAKADNPEGKKKRRKWTAPQPEK